MHAKTLIRADHPRAGGRKTRAKVATMREGAAAVAIGGVDGMMMGETHIITGLHVSKHFMERPEMSRNRERHHKAGRNVGKAPWQGIEMTVVDLT